VVVAYCPTGVFVLAFFAISIIVSPTALVDVDVDVVSFDIVTVELTGIGPSHPLFKLYPQTASSIAVLRSAIKVLLR
jgi:hypothetical protein